MQFLSEKISRFLSSLAPGFEGHYYYVNTGFGVVIMCEVVYKDSIENKKHPLIKICPAWQAEDVLRNLKEIVPDSTPFQRLGFAEHLGRLLLTPDTAYQKIEEYLWSILKI